MNTNTNNIRTQIFGRIRIRIIFGSQFVAEYEYEYLLFEWYSNIIRIPNYSLTSDMRPYMRPIWLSFTEVPWTKESLATKFCNAILNLVIFSCFRAFFMLLHFEVLPRSNKPVPHNYSLLCCDYKTWLTPPFVADFL